MSKNKKLLIWSGVINALFVAFFVYGTILLLKNVNGFTDELKEIFMMQEGLTSEETAEMLNLSATTFISAAIACGLCGIANFVFAFINPKWFVKLRFVNFLISAVNVVTGMNFVSALLVCVACFSKELQYQPAMQPAAGPQIRTDVSMNPTELREQLKLKNMAEKIELVKHLKAEGSISEEEYNKLLDEIITNGVKE